jgi:hypothetical protein
MAAFVSGISGISNMRDSLSSRLSSSIKDQLHTLVEEEEEEEEEPEASDHVSCPRCHRSYISDPYSCASAPCWS